MRLARIIHAEKPGLAALHDGRIMVSCRNDITDLDSAIRSDDGELQSIWDACVAGQELAQKDLKFLPPFSRPNKIICVGLNYADHTAEAGFTQPDYPTIFARFSSSLVGHGAPILKPLVSDQLDFEGELAVIIKNGGRAISKAEALDHVAGYSVFNDASLRDFQMKTTQWTAGKNFDGTGAFGPWFVTADELAPGATGLKIETRLNGNVMQSASTDDMIFSVADLIVILSECMTLEAGDVIVSGTPAGVGISRKPPVFMREGDICEVEIENVGVLRNRISEARAA